MRITWVVAGVLLLCSVQVFAVTGGYQSVDPNDIDVQYAANFAWESIAAADSQIDLTQITNLTVVSASEQIVNGINFKLEMSGDFEGFQLVVDAVVYKTTDGKLSMVSYQTHVNEIMSLIRLNVGGYSPVDVNDPDVDSAADFVWSSIAAMNPNIQLVEALSLKVASAEEQIVEGKNFKLALMGDFGAQNVVTVNAVVNRNLEGQFSLTSYSIQ
jgi:hypothetical protein